MLILFPPSFLPLFCGRQLFCHFSPTFSIQKGIWISRDHSGWIKGQNWPKTVLTRPDGRIIRLLMCADFFSFWIWSEGLWERSCKYDEVIPEKAKMISYCGGRERDGVANKAVKYGQWGGPASCTTSRYAWAINQYLLHIKEQFFHHEWLNFSKTAAVGQYYRVLIQTDK